MDLGREPKLPVFGVPAQVYHFGELIGILEQIRNALALIQDDIRRSPGHVTLPCSVPVAKGQALNIQGGKFRLADRGANIAAHAIAISAGSTTKPARAVLLSGYTGNLSGLTPDTWYWLNNGGAITSVKPATGLIQCLGYALSATEFLVSINSLT